MNRVVLDTNVFIAAAFNNNSASAQIIELVRKGAIEHVWHMRTRAETRALMRKIPPIDFEAYADVFLEKQRYAEKLWEDVFHKVPDPEDRKFAALAQQADAVVITNDEHLLAAANAVPVIKPGVFMRAWSE